MAAKDQKTRKYLQVKINFKLYNECENYASG